MCLGVSGDSESLQRVRYFPLSVMRDLWLKENNDVSGKNTQKTNKHGELQKYSTTLELKARYAFCDLKTVKLQAQLMAHLS